MDLYISIWAFIILLTVTLSIFRYRSRQKKIDAAIREQVENTNYVSALYQRHVSRHPNAPPAYTQSSEPTDWNQNSGDTQHSFNLQPRNQNEVFTVGQLNDQQQPYVYAPPTYEEVILQFNRSNPVQSMPVPENNNNGSTEQDNASRPPPYTIS